MCLLLIMYILIYSPTTQREVEKQAALYFKRYVHSVTVYFSTLCNIMEINNLQGPPVRAHNRRCNVTI